MGVHLIGAGLLPVAIVGAEYILYSYDEVRVLVVPPLVSHTLIRLCQKFPAWRPSLHALPLHKQNKLPLLTLTPSRSFPQVFAR